MKSLKILLFCFIWSGSNTLFAQVDEYIKLEQNRILKAQIIENEVISFVSKNIGSYTLAKEIELETVRHLNEEIELLTDREIEIALENAKVVELRKLFFKTFPEKKEQYTANKIPSSLRQTCVNGDFEDGTVGYSFWSDAHPQPDSGSSFFQSCATPTTLTPTNVVTPSVNNFNSTVTLIDNTAPNYQQYDPVLASFGQNIPTLNSNSGSKSIKLNNTKGYGSSDLTTMSRYIPSINQASIDFNFSLIMDNKIAHGQDIQPYFRVRVLDQYNNVVDQICIIADPENCLFNRINVSNSRRILYTGWVCARLNVQDILNQPGTIEFSVSDCQPSQHFGTVYIDNLCGFVCATPQLGALSLDPTNINCPNATPDVPISVCGTYQPPVNATLNTISLNILQNGILVSTITAPTQLTAETFCFTFLPSEFGANPTGNFEFEVNATFNVACPAGAFIYDMTDNSANVGPDVTFIDCCLPTLTLVSPANNVTNLDAATATKKERSDWIKASNIVQVGDNLYQNGVVYHAGNFVELNPGFEAVLGSQFAAYIEGCSSNYTYRANETNETIGDTNLEEELNLIKLNVEFLIVPNPSNSFVELIMTDSQFENISITTIDGKMVYDKNIELTYKAKVDVSRYANGVYLINILSTDGKVYSKKLIKN